MIERGHEFVQRLRGLAQRSATDWRECPRCGSAQTVKNGSYKRRPQRFIERQEVRVQRHLCHGCGQTYSEKSPDLVARSWYGREVHRMAVDHWVHMRCSLRRTAEVLRSLMGHQERWLIWRWWAKDEETRAPCYLSASTIQRWVVRAGEQAGSPGQWQKVANSGQFGTDGLWARLVAGAKRVVLMMADTATGMIWSTAVSMGESSAEHWSVLFERIKATGLAWADLDGLVSDGAQGLLSFAREHLGRVHLQRCVWHFWRNLSQDVGRVVATVAEEAQDQMRQELTRLLHLILDAPTYEKAEQALAALREIPGTQALVHKVYVLLDPLLYHLLPVHSGLARVSPEWLWRDFRLRLSHGRNHGSEKRLEQAASLWMVYHNFTPAQGRSERKRMYKHPGQSPLQVAGADPGAISYLDALQV
jgi:transposase-like protein